MQATPNKIVAAIALLCAAYGAAHAQSKEADTLEPLIVTSSKTTEPQKKLTQKVTAVNSEEFAAIGAPNRNATELLRYEPGMFVNALSRNDANWGSYGGLGPKYNVMLLDGLPIDSFVDPMGLDPMAFDRVESQRGPGSVMYGNYMSMDFAGNQSPLAGTSNFVLKNRIDEPLTSVGLSYGSWNTFNGRLYNQGKAGNFNYFVGGSYERSNYTGYGMPNSWLDTTQDPAYRKSKIYGKFTYFLDRDDHYISLFANYTQHTGDNGRPNRDYDHSYSTFNFVYANQITPTFGMQAKVGLRDYRRYWSEDKYNPSAAMPDLSWNGSGSVKQRIVPADLTFNWAHGTGGTLTFGADAQWLDYTTFSDNGTTVSTGNDMTARSYGLFAQERYILGDWVLRGGVRYSHTKHNYNIISGGTPGLSGQTWDKWLWSVGARYNLSPRFALYANAGSSFTPPGAKSVGGTLMASDLGVIGKNGQLPNAALRSESGRAFDFGIDAKPFDGGVLGARLFLNQVNDAIVTNVVSQNPSQSRDVNAGNARSSGIELSFKHRINDSFGYFANTTFTNSRVRNPYDAKQNGADLSFVPNNVTNVGFNWRVANTIIAPSVQYISTYYDSTDLSSRRKFGNHAIVNLHVSHEFKVGSGQKINLFADLNNIGNRKFEQPWQFRDVGFNATLGVQAQF